MTSEAMIPTISLDFKKRRIRIPRQTLHLMKDPDYVQLLVNPVQHTVILRACRNKDFQSHRMNYASQNDIELYSKELLTQLSTILPIRDEGRTLRVPGTVNNDHGLAVFEMDNTAPVDTKLPSGKELLL